MLCQNTADLQSHWLQRQLALIDSRNLDSECVRCLCHCRKEYGNSVLTLFYVKYISEFVSFKTS